MHRFIVIVLSVLLIAAFMFASHAALWGLSAIPGWASYLAS